MPKNNKPVLNIILLGDPAAGKATQAKLLSKKYKLFDLDIGKQLRLLQNKKTYSKTILDKTINKGKLAPTKLVRDILFEAIFSSNPKIGILFDGTPKMLGEAKLVSKWMKQTGRTKPLVIYLAIPSKESLRRMATRKEYFKGKYSHRPDDNKEALNNRIKYYHNNISQVLKYLKTRYKFVKINGLGKPLDIYKQLDKEIQKFIK